MVGGVTLTQGGNRVSGGRMVIDLNSGRAVVDGRSIGAPGTQGGSGGRVTGRFTVKKAQ
jgi:lipopolysaccharide export system protein LptA